MVKSNNGQIRQWSNPTMVKSETYGQIPSHARRFDREARMGPGRRKSRQLRSYNCGPNADISQIIVVDDCDQMMVAKTPIMVKSSSHDPTEDRLRPLTSPDSLNLTSSENRGRGGTPVRAAPVLATHKHTHTRTHTNTRTQNHAHARTRTDVQTRAYARAHTQAGPQAGRPAGRPAGKCRRRALGVIRETAAPGPEREGRAVVPGFDQFWGSI